ncbi:hypothetical protein [Clostridium butyricum]|uniref:hypothetical protein n=1 Tax=Clostridium butyricum TaxID=1492 RepID=UPI0034673748
MNKKSRSNIPKWVYVVVVFCAIFIFLCISNLDYVCKVLKDILDSKVVIRLCITFVVLTCSIDYYVSFLNKEEMDRVWKIFDYITYGFTIYTFYYISSGLFNQLMFNTQFIDISKTKLDLSIFLVFSVHAFFRPFPRLIDAWRKLYEFYSAKEVQVG